MEEEEVDDIGLGWAKVFLKNQKAQMEVAKGAVAWPDSKLANEKIEEIRKEAEVKIAAISNKAAAAYYKDDYSIATIEEELEVLSTKSKFLGSTYQ